MLRTPAPLRSLRTWLLVAVAVILVVAVTAIPRDADRSTPDGSVSMASSTPSPRQAPGPTKIRMSSFNLLGAGHTDGAKPKRKGWADSSKRLRWSRQILDQQGIDVVGFQEMHGKQVIEWQANNPDFTSWPLHKFSDAVGHNTISWRSSVFKLVQSKTIMIPYFNGKEQRMPYVLLEHIASGQRLWLYNVHTPANIPNDHQKWRDIGFQRAIELVKKLRAQDPKTPVFMTGDMNDREKFFCPTVGNTDLVAANGGHATPTSCTTPRPMMVDWVLGSAPATFSDYTALRTPLVKKTTDHPVITATATLPSAAVQASPISRVVVVTAEGLRAASASTLTGNGQMPTLKALREAGSHTFNARSAVESAAPLSNLVSVLSGRPVALKNAGHGVTRNTLRTTVHQAARGYVPTVFDQVHDAGRRTVLHSSSKVTAPVRTSWNRQNGALDLTGKDNGRSKIDRYTVSASDRKTVQEFWKTRAKPGVYTHIHLVAPRAAGEKHGFKSKKYAKALRQFDRNLKLVRRTIDASPQLRGQTMLVVTATAGGQGRSGTDRMAVGTYKVPLFVHGPGVPAGQSLYTLNPAWSWPGSARVGYAKKPMTTGVVANLALTVLRLPVLPRSTLNAEQNFNVLTTPQ